MCLESETPDHHYYYHMSEFPPNMAIRPLLIDDLDQVEALEILCFPEKERASRETLAYRLTACPELCLGLFIREYDYRYNQLNQPEVAERLERQHKEEDESDHILGKLAVRKETLVAHVIGTKIGSTRITAESMQIATADNKDAGHIEGSRVIGVHSVAVDPEWRGRSFATLLMHDYIQRMLNQEVADKIVILVHQSLIQFYTRIGFTELGRSLCEFGDGKWWDMSINLAPDMDESFES